MKIDDWGKGLSAEATSVAYTYFDRASGCWLVKVSLGASYTFERERLPPSSPRRAAALKQLGWSPVGTWAWSEEQNGKYSVLTGTVIVESVSDNGAS
ncbi:hypothetical protein GCM10022403_080160 [Streptomyces coacervatus]|uniref:Uncharacterized protein n=1 Tax=Streptomyces coacervatus TaxID=647381 RepID=A0ABP7J704_9ACTN